MKFKFFSSNKPQTQLPTTLDQSGPADIAVDAERAALAAALHKALEGWTQSFKDKEHLARLCSTIVEASPRLRLVWVGFCDETDVQVRPHAVVGAALPESDDWRLPQACFNYAGPFSQVSLESVGSVNDLNSLFSPWRANMEACSASCALAIPLRSEKRDLRGLIVFYADDVNYFSGVGLKSFQAFCYLTEIVWQQSSLMQLLTQKAQLDTLTGMMNRRKMMYELQKAVDRADRENELLSIMILRIEGFGKINDIHGWHAADALLAAFAREITLQTRAQDRVGRWTGVEFLYILPRTDQQHAEFLAHGLQAYFSSHPMMINEQPVRLSLHIGVATYETKETSLDELVRQATRSMLATIPASAKSGAVSESPQ